MDGKHGRDRKKGKGRGDGVHERDEECRIKEETVLNSS